MEQVDEGEDPEEVVRSVLAYRGHNYGVTYDQPIQARSGILIRHDLCAAIELELLTT